MTGWSWLISPTRINLCKLYRSRAARVWSISSLETIDTSSMINTLVSIRLFAALKVGTNRRLRRYPQGLLGSGISMDSGTNCSHLCKVRHWGMKGARAGSDLIDLMMLSTALPVNAQRKILEASKLVRSSCKTAFNVKVFPVPAAPVRILN